MFFTVTKLSSQPLLTIGRTVMRHKIKKLTAQLTLLGLGALLLSPFVSSATFANCDTAVPPTTPPEHFTNNRDGTITDNTTGLMWTLCLYGQIGSDCTGTDINVNGGSVWEDDWDSTLVMVNNTYLLSSPYLDYTGWRIPNVKELASILEAQCSFPALNPLVFPINSGGTVVTWTSSPNMLDAQNIWAVDFYADGDIHPLDRTMTGHLRLVRDSKSDGIPN